MCEKTFVTGMGAIIALDISRSRVSLSQRIKEEKKDFYMCYGKINEPAFAKICIMPTAHDGKNWR